MITIEKKSLKVGKYVDTEHANTVIREYKKERWVHNSERMGKADSLSAWYSVEELEDFIETSKMHGADGIKFYFAAYPQAYAEKPEYAGRQTLVLVATKQKQTDTGVQNKDVYIHGEGNPLLLAYNQASLCPPICNGSFGDSDLGVFLIDQGEQGMSVL